MWNPCCSFQTCIPPCAFAVSHNAGGAFCATSSETYEVFSFPLCAPIYALYSKFSIPCPPLPHMKNFILRKKWDCVITCCCPNTIAWTCRSISIQANMELLGRLKRVGGCWFRVFFLFGKNSCHSAPFLRPNMRFLLKLKERVDFQPASVQGPHWTSRNRSSIFHSPCHRSRIFNCIPSTPGMCAAIHSLSQPPCSG